MTKTREQEVREVAERLVIFADGLREDLYTAAQILDEVHEIEEKLNNYSPLDEYYTWLDEQIEENTYYESEQAEEIKREMEKLDLSKCYR